MFSEAVSHTALLTAAGRAAESMHPARLFVDPHAEILAGVPGRALLDQHPAPERLVASLAVRTRLFDDLVTSFVAGAPRRCSCWRRVLIRGPGGSIFPRT